MNTFRCQGSRAVRLLSCPSLVPVPCTHTVTSLLPTGPVRGLSKHI